MEAPSGSDGSMRRALAQNSSRRAWPSPIRRNPRSSRRPVSKSVRTVESMVNFGYQRTRGSSETDEFVFATASRMFVSGNGALCPYAVVRPARVVLRGDRDVVDRGREFDGQTGSIAGGF